MYKLLVTDYDGTLIKRDGTISDNQLKTINSFIEKGGLFAVITGRMTASILPIVRKLGLKGLVASFNGGELVEIQSGKALYSHEIDNKIAVEIFKVTESENAYVHGYTSYEYFTPIRTKMTDFYEDITKVAPTLIDRPLSLYYAENGKNTNKILVMDEPPVLDRIFPKLLPFKKDLQVIRSNPYQIEITDKSSTKATALENIAKTFNVPISQTVAVGDAGNDCSMIERAGLGIAVQNAEDSAKKVADVTLEYSNEQDAIMHIICDYFK